MTLLPPPAALPLPVARYRLRFTAGEPLRLPAYAGSAWRGAFGHALKRLVCVTREPRCPDCLLYRSCAYPYLFETPPDPAVALLRKYPAAPHPFLLRPPADTRRPLAAGEETDARPDPVRPRLSLSALRSPRPGPGGRTRLGH